MSSVKKSIETAESAQAAGAGTGEDAEVVVGLNGRFYKIRRGVTVEVPRAVALILQQSEEQDAATLEMIEAIRDGKQHQG